MKTILAAAAVTFATLAPCGASAADLGGYEESGPAVVQRERIIERYYEPAPVVVERRVYVEPRVYYEEPRVARYYREPYRYVYGYRGWDRGYYGPRWGYRHRYRDW